MIRPSSILKNSARNQAVTPVKKEQSSSQSALKKAETPASQQNEEIKETKETKEAIKK